MTAVPPRTRVLRAALCAFCLYHMAATLALNLPMGSPFGGELRAPFERYAQYTGLWQNWAMFTTIPYFQAIRPSIVARYADGTTRKFGPMLPGLRAYEHRTRLASMFYRFTWPGGDIQPFVRLYLSRACLALQKRGERPQMLAVELEADRLVSLAEVQASGRTSRVTTDLGGVLWTCQ